MADLTPCPFCGAPAQYKELLGWWAAECTMHCAATRAMKNKENTAEIWSRGTS